MPHGSNVSSRDVCFRVGCGRPHAHTLWRRTNQGNTSPMTLIVISLHRRSCCLRSTASR
jgi:hypothetical protein